MLYKFIPSRIFFYHLSTRFTTSTGKNLNFFHIKTLCYCNHGSLVRKTLDNYMTYRIFVNSFLKCIVINFKEERMTARRLGVMMKVILQAILIK